MTPHPILLTLFTEVDRRKLSHSDLSAGTGISRTTFSFWRNGLRSPRLEEVDKLAKFLNFELRVLGYSSF
jgi:transcriptional regulator with XRE-family HTH domain